MIDYVRERWLESGMILPVSVKIRDGGGGSGNMAAVDEHGFILVEEDESVRVIPWGSVVTMKLLLD